MTSMSIVPRLNLRQQWSHWRQRAFNHVKPSAARYDLHQLAQEPTQLPPFVRQSPVAMRYLRLLGPLAWDRFPERDLETNWHIPAMPYAPFVAAYLVKLDQHQVYMSQLRQYLVEHPALVWLLGFPLTPSRQYAWGFDVEATLPTHRHFTRILRKLPNACLQFLLDETVRLLQAELGAHTDDFGRAISLDTKHIIAWVKENNPKAYAKDRFDKTQQPAGDPDCKLGCKRKRNQRTAREPPPTPLKDGVPANTLQVGEYYWGYGSGVVATKVPGWGEFVLAELTQPFDRPDVSYFFPLMTDTERRLGFRPSFGALDAGFDAFYVYEYFHQAGGFAAVPFVLKGKTPTRIFSDDGLPLCKARLPMPLEMTYTSRTTSLIEHEKGRYACPLFHPEPSGQLCPIGDPHWAKGGCKTSLATSVGARIRHQLDREGEAYKQVYKQRTATERVNSQAVALGIERPKLRNGQAIANLNTLIYVLINLRALHRVRRKIDLLVKEQ
jgi:hypothetical protein